MNMAYVTTKAVSTFSLAQALSTVVATVKLSLAQRREYIEACREMQSLSNRDLSDIGITRGEITAIARRHVYGA